MPEQLLNLLKLCLLALLYLFFLRVARAVWVEVGGPRLRRGRGSAHNGDSAAAADPAQFTAPAGPTVTVSSTGHAAGGAADLHPPRIPLATASTRSRGQALLPTSSDVPPEARAGPMAGSGPELVTVAPQEAAGRRYPLTGELTIGRASGCQVLLEDTYVSQLHARVFLTPEGAYVEDLGSTNGTYLLRDRDRQQERHKVAGPRLLERGDQVQVGSTVMELVV